MTTINTLTVVLEKSVRSEQAEITANAIRQMKNVVEVGLNEEDFNNFAAKMQIRHEMLKEIFELISNHK